jgi:hypothetical protein
VCAVVVIGAGPPAAAAEKWSAEELHRRSVERRAIEAVSWGMPAVNFDLMRQAMVWFAPKAPAGKETNWVPTSARGQFEVLFRLYGPEKAFFDKAWTLPDIEQIARP